MRRVINPDREKKRYLKIEVLSSEKIDYKELKNAIKNNFRDLFGGLKTQETNIKLIKNLYLNNIGILRVLRENVKELKFSVLFLRKIKNEDVIIKTSISE